MKGRTTMKTVVVYESMFGNTEHVARTIAEALQRAGSQVTVTDVSQVQPSDLEGCDLLVLGGPTHAFSLSRQSTRDDAVRQGADPARAALGLREWLTTLDGAFQSGGDRPAVAVFDTRVDKVRHLPGSAAKRAARSLRSQGFEVLDRPTSFYVADLKGPPDDGELDRAGSWATRLADGLRSRSHRDVS
jgi:flavodoxin